MYIPQKDCLREFTDTVQILRKSRDTFKFITVVTSGVFHGTCSHWSPIISPSQNLFEHPIFYWLPPVKADQEVTTWPCRPSSWVCFTVGFRSTNGKVFEANQRMQKSKCTTESSPTALWQQQQGSDKIWAICTGCCTAQKTLLFIALPDFEESQVACDGRRYFIFQTVFVQKRWVGTTKCLLETFYSCTEFCLIPGRWCWVGSTLSSLSWSSICSFSAASWKRSIRNKTSLFLRENVRGNKRLIWV